MPGKHPTREEIASRLEGHVGDKAIEEHLRLCRHCQLVEESIQQQRFAKLSRARDALSGYGT